MIESIYSDAFLLSILNGDATLTGATALNGQYVYLNRAPQTRSYPLGIIRLYDAQDINTSNGVRAFTRPLYKVFIVAKVVGSVMQDAARVRVSANRLDAKLQKIERQSFTVDGVTFNFNVWREDELPPPREEDGSNPDEHFRIYGGIYRVEVFD